MDIHSHCNTCYKINCKYEQCKIIDCNYGCKSEFHACKQQDHHLICSKARIPCLSSNYGCSLVLLRSNLNKHLKNCPASVIHCSFEWNRWSVDSKNSSLTPLKDNEINYEPLKDLNSNLYKALAYRDQLMLKDLYEFKKLRHILRNQITKNYLPVPIKSYLSGLKVLNFNSNELDKNSNSSLVKCNSFVSTNSNATSTLTTISDDESDIINPPGLRNSVLGKLKNSNNLLNLVDENKEIEINNLEQQKSNKSSSSSNSSTDNENDNQNEKPNSTCIIKKTKRKINLKDIDKLNHFIVDLNIEFIVNHHTKPKRMYTFRCGSNFRRDEYSNHYENIHSDIMGKQGFMIKECPNSQYGCDFFITRIHPLFNNCKSKIIFSQLNKSFGHQINEFEIVNNKQKINLNNLPIQVISKIIGYLDGFSLNNLSLTNKFFRLLVNDQLERKGLVNLIWKKIKKSNSDKLVWTEIGYQWSFSNSIDHIKKWKFENDDKMLNHMTNCKYFDRLIRKEPYKLVGLHDYHRYYRLSYD